MDNKILSVIVMNNLRILNQVTPSDLYYNHYKWYYKKYDGDFFDLYHLCWKIGATKNPKKIMEIGCRTGLSIAQLLSACFDYIDKKVVIFDRFDDGMCSPQLVLKHLEYLAIPSHFITFYTGDSTETVPEFKKTNTDLFDWILVDGGHTPEQLLIDLENVVDLVAPEGVIVVDDISATVDRVGFNLRPAWNEFKEKYFEKFQWFEDNTGKGTAWAIRHEIEWVWENVPTI